mgnify:CR=1 FL=1
MANFNVSLKKLTEKVSLDVVYTPKGLEEINVEIAEVNRPGLFLAMITLISSGCRSWVWPR